MASPSQSTNPLQEQVTISDDDVEDALKNICGARGVTLGELKRFFKHNSGQFSQLRERDLRAEVTKAVERCVQNSMLVTNSKRFVLSQVSVNMACQKQLPCCTRNRRSNCRRCIQRNRPCKPKKAKCPIKKRKMYRVRTKCGGIKMVRAKPRKCKKSDCEEE